MILKKHNICITVIYNSEDYGQGTNSGVTEKANKMWKTDLCGVLPISLWFEGDFACLGLH